jgi:hypothetical protein
MTNESALSVDLAVSRINDNSFYFGFTDRWSESICLFHKWFGGSLRSFELKNNRPTKHISLQKSDYESYDLDTIFVRKAKRIFEKRLKAAECHGR